MRELSKKLNEIVNKFMEENVAEETKHDFIIVAINFNINLNVCTKYDLMRIYHKAKESSNAEEKKILTTASIYSYILIEMKYLRNIY